MQTGMDLRSLNLPTSFRLKENFRDVYERRAYVRACLLAMRLIDQPSLLDCGRAFLDRFVRNDPRQRQIYNLWMEAFQLSLIDLVARLLSDDELGANLRETAPVFVVIPANEVIAADKYAAR